MNKAEEYYRNVFGVTLEDTPELNSEQKVIVETMEGYADTVVKILSIHGVMQAERPVCPCYCDMWNAPDKNGDIYCSCGKKV